MADSSGAQSLIPSLATGEHDGYFSSVTFAPIALFLYRRPEHTRRTLLALARCKELADSPLHIYSDAAKTRDAEEDVRQTRSVARSLAPKSAVFIERTHNMGLARSIIDGVSELTKRYGKVIVIEDDLEVAPSFLWFMNAGLERYADDERVMQVSGYQFPVALPDRPVMLSFVTSWGWATWERSWRHFDPDAKGYAALKADPALRRRFDLDDSYPFFDMLERQRRGEVDSWAIRWHLSVFMRDGLVLYPPRSLVRNTGFDGSGTHTQRGTGHDDHDVSGLENPSWELPDVELDVAAQRQVFSFRAQHSRKQRNRRIVQDAALKWTRKLLAHPRIPMTVRSAISRVIPGVDPTTQDLDLYWDPKMAEILDTWGIGTTWNEIQLLLINTRGKVLDIACGTGKVMTLLAPYEDLEVHGFDISDFLIQKAIDRGLGKDRLRVADATKTPYATDQFDYSYSIGSLEHFTNEGIVQFVAEAHRITRRTSMHMIPVARSGRDEGWMKTHQSFHNNSVEWWLQKFKSSYSQVQVFESAWNDKISVGKWFVCTKADGE